MKLISIKQQRVNILFTTKLVETMSQDLNLGNGYYGSDVQLRVNEDGFWMTSPITGNHFVPSSHGIITKRVQEHWNGFKINQTK